MKRILIIIACLLIMPMAFADVLTDLLDLALGIHDMVSSGIRDSSDAFKSGNDSLDGAIISEDPGLAIKSVASLTAPSLDLAGRIEMYENYRRRTLEPLALSLFMGCGSGQRALGDCKGSAWLTPIDVVGLSTAAAGGVTYFLGWLACAFWLEAADTPSDLEGFMGAELGQGCAVIAIAGPGVSVFSRLIAFIRVLSWADSNNRSLRESLGLDSVVRLMIEPSASARFPGLKLGAAFSY